MTAVAAMRDHIGRFASRRSAVCRAVCLIARWDSKRRGVALNHGGQGVKRGGKIGAGEVGKDETRGGRNRADRNARRAERDGAWRNEAGETGLGGTSS